MQRLTLKAMLRKVHDMGILNTISRIVNAIFYGINQKRAKDAEDDPSANLTGNNQLRQSDKSYADISNESKSDKT